MQCMLYYPVYCFDYVVFPILALRLSISHDCTCIPRMKITASTVLMGMTFST